jgi:hypothetical protein
MLTVPVRTVRTGHVAGPYRWQVHTGHVVAPGHDTCHAYLALSAYGLTNLEVTRVTTGRVTRGT